MISERIQPLVGSLRFFSAARFLSAAVTTWSAQVRPSYEFFRWAFEAAGQVVECDQRPDRGAVAPRDLVAHHPSPRVNVL
jgi:hypothetical protein